MKFLKQKKKFTKEDKKDLEEIYQIFEVDEESEIKKLNSSSDIGRLEELTKKLKIWFKKAEKLGGYGGLLFVLPSNWYYDLKFKDFLYSDRESYLYKTKITLQAKISITSQWFNIFLLTTYTFRD